MLALAFAAGAGGAAAKAVGPEQLCAGPQLPPKKAPQFEDYLVAAPRAGKPPPLKLKSPEARRYATQLKRAYQSGPVFAGTYRLAAWNCGAGCTQFAMIDARSGEVRFDEEVRTVADAAWNPFERLNFRPDSRLLMISGAPNEDERRNGVAFYDWDGERLILLKRYRYDQVCRAN
jgi:hypothetical protein